MLKTSFTLLVLVGVVQLASSASTIAAGVDVTTGVCGSGSGVFGCYSHSNVGSSGTVTDSILGQAFGQPGAFHGVGNATSSASFGALRTYADVTMTMDTNGTRQAGTHAVALLIDVLHASGFLDLGSLCSQPTYTAGFFMDQETLCSVRIATMVRHLRAK